MRYPILTLLLIPTLFLSNGYTQDYKTWGLPEGAKARLGKGKIIAIEFSPDGSQIAVLSPVGIWLYDSQSGKELALFPGHKPRFSTSVSSGVGSTLTIETFAFSHDGRLLASASRDGTIRLLDLTTYRERYPRLETKSIFVNPLEEVSIIALAFSPDEQTLTTLESSGHKIRKIKVWDVNSGRLLSDVSERILNKAKDPAKPDRPLKPFSLSPDGKTFAATKSGVRVINGVSDAVVRLGDVSTGNLHPTFMSAKSVRSLIQRLVFSPDGTLLAGVETKTNVAKNPDIAGKHIWTTRSKIRIWNVRTGNELSTVIPQQVDSPQRGPFVAFSPDRKTFATATEDIDAVQLWEVNTGNLISTFTIPRAELTAPWDPRGAIDLTFAPDGKTLAIATAGVSGFFQLWEVRTGKIVSTLTEHSWLFAQPVNGEAFISWSGSGIQLRDIHTGKIQQDLKEIWTNLITSFNEINEVESSAFSLDSTTFAVGSKDGSLQLWNVGAEKQPPTLVAHTDSVNTLAFTTDGTRLASGSRDRSIQLWDVRTRTLLLNLTEHTNSGRKLEHGDGTTRPSAEWLNNLVFSPDGTTLASASALGTIWLWNLNTGQLLTTLTTHEAGARELPAVDLDKIGLAFSPDNTRLASGGIDGQVMVSEVSANPNPLIFTGNHAWRVEALAFSPDGKYLASGSEDKSIRIWNTEIGIECAILGGHFTNVNALAFSADGTTLISSSEDGTILLWDWEQIAQQTDR